MAASAINVLSAYLDARAAVGAPTAPDAPMWWTPLRRRGYSYGMTEKLLVRVMRCAGLKPAQCQRGPRVHDLRHTYVGHRMMQWYRDGVDPQTRLPHLATYLGHKDIRSTLVYLNITPQLVAAGVDITVIRSLLGHVSLDTTNHHARANIETKRRALEQVDRSTQPGSPPRWRRNPELLDWLDSL